MVVASRQIVETIVAAAIRRGGCQHVTIVIQQVDGDIINTRLAAVDLTIAVHIVPNSVAQAIRAHKDQIVFYLTVRRSTIGRQTSGI